MNSIPAPPRTYRKHFIPLESNPELFTELIHKLGLSKSLEFQDVLSLDDPDLLAFLPRPAYALILVFPTTELYEKRVHDEDSLLEMIDGDLPDGDVLFFKQTINNACGLYAILHAVCNGEVRDRMGMHTPSTFDAPWLTCIKPPTRSSPQSSELQKRSISRNALWLLKLIRHSRRRTHRWLELAILKRQPMHRTK